jgi:DNA ligase 1
LIFFTFMTPASISRRYFNLRLLTLLGATGWGTRLAAKANPEVLLAFNAPAGIDPAGYLVSEKLDGVRALWDGVDLRFRSGRAVAAPAWFTAKLPKTALDGELWIARGTFDTLSGIVRKVQPVDAQWQQVKYMVFELPASEGSQTRPFEQRSAQLQNIVETVAWPQLQAIEQFKAANRATLQAKLQDVVQGGGEGLMLHLASAPITAGRSQVLLKLKPVQDAEAIVIGHVPGKGKYTGLTGALEVNTEGGQRFKLGTGLSDAQRAHPPAIGSTVTYTYRDLTPSGKPRFASFLRVFDDS